MPHLKLGSYGKRISRHYVNLGLILHPDHYALFNFLVYMSDLSNTFKYSTLLLRQFRKASIISSEIYKVPKVKYATSLPTTRKSFIYLVENCLIIKLNKPGYYMINPYLVYSSNQDILPNAKHIKECEKIMSEDDPIKLMQDYCNILHNRFTIEQERLKREQVRFNKERIRKKNESKKNKSKGRKKRSVPPINS